MRRSSTAERRDFSLQSVCWGYRDIFARTIEALHDDGWLGENRPEVTERFYDLLNQADQSCFDHVLKEFICALNPSTHWLMELPGIFSDVLEAGRKLAEDRLYIGVAYFRILGQDGFGDSPRQVRALIAHLRRLREIDPVLALALLKNYRNLLERLHLDEVGLYIREALKVYHNNPKSGIAFLEGTLTSCEAMIRLLTQESRLEDVNEKLSALLRALTGYEVEVADLGQLDSDPLIERGTSMVCMYQWLYLPVRLRLFGDAAMNRRWYLLQALAAAAMLAENGFSRIHGHPQYETCADLVGQDMRALNLFQAFDAVRALRRALARWPGAVRLVRFGLRTECEQRPPMSGADRLFFELMDCPQLAQRCLPPDQVEAWRARIDACANTFAVADLALCRESATLLAAFPDLGHVQLRTFTFLPDALYPGSVSTPPPKNLVANLKEAARDQQQKRDHGDKDDADAGSMPSSGVEQGDDDENEAPEQAIDACYLYDEWSKTEDAYYRDYCRVYECRPDISRLRAPPPNDCGEEAAQVRKIFERLKPDILRKEKYLEDGEIINPDILVDYIIERGREPSPRIRFYERTHARERDLAVVILLDVSGSTGESVEREKVIDIEKRTALILGEGLASLGDRFAVCGFSSNGREHCHYIIYKTFAETWDSEARQRIFAAYPADSTRIGAALRHTGFKLSRLEARRRLTILVTDGKPMDSHYDPNTRYAQYDVRMACEENERLGVHTFAVSTQENSLADMEIMFPGRRFAILNDIRDLPKVLPGLYIKLTV